MLKPEPNEPVDQRTLAAGLLQKLVDLGARDRLALDQLLYKVIYWIPAAVSTKDGRPGSRPLESHSK